MNGNQRRSLILEKMQNSSAAVSGTTFASQFQVSRQIIVSDIALLRASGHDIISTNRGYILNTSHDVSMQIKVLHDDNETEDELNTIVDLGGTVKDVYVNHKVYGKLSAELNIRSRKNVNDFLADIKRGKSTPLKNITSGYHYHTITADCQETLNLIYNELNAKGYIVKAKGYD